MVPIAFSGFLAGFAACAHADDGGQQRSPARAEQQQRIQAVGQALEESSSPPRSVASGHCNLNGNATVTGSCVCLAAWTGPTCGVLALLPAHRGAGLHAESNLSSWGGAVAFDEASGRWQMFGNELVGGCGINSWEANSRIVRATTADLDQPFVVEQVVMPAFASEPSLARLGDQWLLYSIGNTSSTKPARTDCVAGYTPAHAAPNGTGGNFKAYVPVSVSVSSSLMGPWKLVSTFGNGDFNPAPFVFRNGTTLLMWRHLARVHMVRAAGALGFGGPFAFNGSDNGCPVAAANGDKGCRWWHLFNKTVDKRGLEDPFIWEQPDGTNDGITYHALFHDHTSFGGHAYSRDAVSWTFSDTGEAQQHPLPLPSCMATNMRTVGQSRTPTLSTSRTAPASPSRGGSGLTWCSTGGAISLT